MEAVLQRELGCSRVREVGHSGGGGCISHGQSYTTDTHTTVFTKINHKHQARRMFDGEKASLDAISATNTIRVPKPIKVVDLEGGGAMFIMEHVEMKSLNKCATQMGEQLADLHLHNQREKEKQRKDEQTVGKGAGQCEVPVIDRFGFHIKTCCGYIPQVNDWQEDWVEFYTRQRLQPQLAMVEESYGDREARELWASLQLKIPQLFGDLQVEPSLLHGDLWSGNVAEYADGPIMFDPASFYGHSEFELAIAGMFGGFGKNFYTAYHQKIPKAPGFEKRHELYRLFHYLNHWNHFGTGYRGSSLRIMKELSK